ncbi:TetR/AcrR family transcriptional regulator [Paenibacillus barcinonensis]|uniref:TetR/AcrR family transcriptional regulator n=1 Tax=Paenibacillus barcinonensis TaxID=198119 RepID=A0ABX6QCK0_PAEBA|nr:TetR/AcrR family transcriptional regulator [Paenibacillus barcinonensis]
MNENWHQQLKNQHREHLIEAGKQLFLKHGLLQVKIKDVCAQAKLSRVTFYKHFQSLDELMLTIQMQLFDTLTEHISQAARPQEKGLAQLAAMLHAWVHFAQTHPDHIRFIQLFDMNYEVYRFPDELRATYDEFTRNGKENHFLLHALTAGTADGSIRNPAPPLKLAQFIFTVMMGMLQKMVTRRSGDIHPLDDQMMKQLVDMLLHYASHADTGWSDSANLT